MANRKRERYKIEPRISVPFMLELEYESKIIKKLLVIKEIRSWLPLGLHRRKVCSQEHIFLITNSLYVRNLVENVLFSTLILGSVFNDYVVFYRDVF